MYEAFFGLRQKPFSLLPDPRFLYPSRAHRMALTLLEYGLAEQAGFVVLTGEVGTGKTTLLRAALGRLGRDVVVGLVTNTHHSFGELMRWVLLAFGLEFRGRDAVEQYDAFVSFLLERYGQRKRVVLMIDEAQNLSEEALEQLRMLSNVNAEGDHLLQLVLVGQPELRGKLTRPELRQFAQRVAMDYDLRPLAREETEAYVGHRLATAGAQGEIFTGEALGAVHFFTRGIPRLINSLCDLALVYAYAEGRAAVDGDTVVEVARERSASGLAPFTNLPLDLGTGEAALSAVVAQLRQA